jgi:DeoR/GlpR family transcriptional regulator of sugar metabolism
VALDLPVALELADDPLVADSTKFQGRALMEVCRLEEVHHIITDRGLPPEVARALRRMRIRLTLV